MKFIIPITVASTIFVCWGFFKGALTIEDDWFLGGIVIGSIGYWLSVCILERPWVRWQRISSGKQ